ncbi:TRAP transporter permease [Mariniblastus fucicola]|uniref:Sialic acid TRAP transporter permease protein SiaT n=1 Tax=Mariniblastus fucicola TaxID=980251 RepID=A0A5B9PFD1_9BACT|nr:TRAP transporter fused permease subunit [Mariniblastus fucicola]QEG23532.1 Sialic acid TRAP transporter permease protein SiaT [Mariniblastus fucicola]
MNDLLKQPGRVLFGACAIALCIFVLVGVNTTLFEQHASLAVFGMLGLVLVFLSRPAIKRFDGTLPLKIVDGLLIVATIVVFGYVFSQTSKWCEPFWIDGVQLGDRAGNEKSIDFVFAGIGMLLVLEATRRIIGWTLPILCGVFITYAIYGQSMPDWLFPHVGSSWAEISQASFLQSGGVFGIALRVMFLYVFLFVLFGTLLEQTGATGYVIRFARRLFKNSSGSPAKVAVVSSGLMGSLSGSAVANTATTGTFTIPLMKSSGFDSNTAGGIEAAASSGGALMPPIMGAGAYMMLETVTPAVQLFDILKAALIPAILYYTALLLTVHFHAKRINATADPELSDAKEGKSSETYSNYQGFVFFGAFIILIVMLLWGKTTVFKAVSVSLVSIIFLSLPHKSTRLDFGKLGRALIDAGKGGMTLIVAASCVGIILGVVELTGLGARLPATIQGLANDSEILALLLLMVSTIILGMGLPSAVCYLLMALLVGEVLTTLNTPPLAAHLFIFYFGMMSMVTPPVALAAYAAAAISKGDVMGTAFAAFRFALVGFALPFAFVLKPELLMLTVENTAASPLMVAATVAVTLVGIVGLAASIAGFAMKRIGWSFRVVLLVLSLAVFFTRCEGIQLAIQLIAAASIVGLILVNAKLKPPVETAPDAAARS